MWSANISKVRVENRERLQSADEQNLETSWEMKGKHWFYNSSQFEGNRDATRSTKTNKNCLIRVFFYVNVTKPRWHRQHRLTRLMLPVTRPLTPQRVKFESNRSSFALNVYVFLPSSARNFSRVRQAVWRGTRWPRFASLNHVLLNYARHATLHSMRPLSCIVGVKRRNTTEKSTKGSSQQTPRSVAHPRRNSDLGVDCVCEEFRTEASLLEAHRAPSTKEWRNGAARRGEGGRLFELLCLKHDRRIREHSSFAVLRENFDETKRNETSNSWQLSWIQKYRAQNHYWFDHLVGLTSDYGHIKYNDC